MVATVSAFVDDLVLLAALFVTLQKTAVKDFICPGSDELLPAR
jgi:hypothetical protein